MQRACYRIGGIVTIHCRIGLEAYARLDVKGIIATLKVCRASLRHPLYALRSETKSEVELRQRKARTELYHATTLNPTIAIARQ